MAMASVLVVCPQLSHRITYAIDLINLLCQMGKFVHVVQDMCTDGQEDRSLLHNGMPDNNLLTLKNQVSLYTSRNIEQSLLNNLARKQRCQLVVWITKNGAGQPIAGLLA